MLNNSFCTDRLFILFFIGILMIPVLVFADADKIFKENSKAVVVVVTLDEKGEPLSQGSGFIVRPDGAVVTNYHVISEAKDIKVKVGGKVLDVEGVLYTDKENDLVILKAKGEKLQTVKIGDSEKATIGEKVYVISSPKGMENTISDGLLSGIREISSDKKVLQITAPISPGSSGSPVFNKNGEVIGIATFLLKEAQNLNFAMPVNLIKDKIRNIKITSLKESGIEDYKKTAEHWFYLGYVYVESGKYKEAIDSFEQALRIKPDYAEVHYNLGYVYVKLGKYKDAIDSYKQAIRIKPDLEMAHNNLGIAYDDLGKYKESIESFKQAIRINPDYTEAHINLGVAYGNSGKYKEAIESFKQAIRIKPDYAEAHYNLGNTYSLSGMYKEAFESFKQAIRIKPDYAEAHNNLGLTCDDLGMYKEAIESFKQAILINPDDVEAHNNLGYAYNKSGMYKEAIESFKQAIRIKPDYAEAHNRLGLAYEYSGMDREAIESFKQAIRIKPDYAEAHLGLGISYLLIKDRGLALEEYKILKELDKEMANQLFDLIYK